MPNDPVSAFLQGFAVVDQLETNRATRKFTAEKQSRLRTLWQREDQAYEREELDRYKFKKGAEFDARMTDLRKQIADEYLAARDSGDAKFAKHLDTKYYGKDSLEFLTQQVINDMVATDPSFGEHIGLSLGQDPAAGPLVKDKSRPVSGIGLLGPRKNSEGGVYIQINGVNGPAPLTKDRSARGGDEVFMGQIGKAELVNIFGPEALGNSWESMVALRSKLGLDEPTAALPGQQRGESTQRTEQQPDVSDAQSRTSDFVTADGTTVRASSAERLGLTQEQVNGMSYDEFNELSKEAGGFATPQTPQIDVSAESPFPAPEIDPGSLQRLEEQGIDPFTGTNVRDRGFSEGERQFAKKIPFVRWAISDVPVTTGDVVESNKTNGTASANELQNGDPATVKEKVPGYESPEDATQGVNTMMQSARKGKRPHPADLFLGLMNVKAGFWSEDEFRQYRRTGQIGQAAEVKFINMGKGILAATTSDGQVRFTQVPGFGDGADGGKPATVQDHAALQALYEKYTQDIEDPGYRQDAINAMQGAATILGAGSDTKSDLASRAKSDVSSMLRGGMDMINEFDEDTIQGLWDAGNLDFSWGDFEIGMNAGNVAISSQLYMSRVGNKFERAHAMRDYTRDFKGMFPAMLEQRMAERVSEIEHKIKQGMAMAQDAGVGVIPTAAGKDVIVKPGDTPHEIRQKIFEVLKKG